MRFLFDENLPLPAARALRDVGEAVSHVQLEDLRGLQDIALAALLRDGGWVFVTADTKIAKRVQERAALISAGVGAFVFSGKAQRTGAEWLALIFRRWSDIKRYAVSHGPPYLVQVPDRGALRQLR